MDTGRENEESFRSKAIGTSVLPWPQCIHGAELKRRVSDARILAVGAGGIGCELLKSLVLSGFRNIEVIDLDTIELSNLNRQFLFRKHHIGESKAKVAAEAVRTMRPNVTIVDHHANVKDSQFDVDFFRRFDMVLNGLDNLDARRHVNRMCLAANVPLVESGTAGFLGQTSVHVPRITECFDCQPKPRQKSYAVCTIRTSPEKPIHCIVWAKDLLFQRLFGPQEAENDVDEERQMDRRTDEGALEYAKRVFDIAFGWNIEKLLLAAATSKDDVFDERRPKPKPIFLEQLLLNKDLLGGEMVQRIENAANAQGTAAEALALSDNHAVWSVSENALVFLESTRRLLEERASEVGVMSVDKDDALAMEFVTAAANLRATCYNIPTQSIFDAKGMAGNIIHAIATTNAIIAGLVVQEALKLLAAAGDSGAIMTHCRSTFLRQDVSNRRIISPVSLESPNPGCVVCGKAKLEARLDTLTWTLQDFISKIAKGQLSMVAPTLTFQMFLYEEGEDLDPDEVEENKRHLPKRLSDLPSGGITHNTVIELSDQAQSLTVEMIVSHQESWDEEAFPEKFHIAGKIPKAEKENGNSSNQPEATQTKLEVSMGKRSRLLEEDEGGAILLVDDDEARSKKIKIVDNDDETNGTEDVIDLLD